MAKKKPVKDSLGGDALRRKLREDDTYLKYRRILKNIKEKMDSDKFYDEVDALHSGRSMRNLYGTTPGAEKISNAVLQDVRCRSRLVELILKATRHHDLLDIVLSETRKYLATKFVDDVVSLKTKAERMTYFDIYLSAGLETKANLMSMVEAANLIVKDIDQCSFATRHLVECLSLVMSHNNDRQRA